MTDPEQFLVERARRTRVDVRPIPLGELARWHLGDDLAHDTRRFFTVEGLAVATNFGRTPRWGQPIIHQPEIGILGFLARRRAGRLELLAQAKMEPGNRTPVQLAPTVQATPSNYTRVHGGGGQPFLEHFLAPSRGRVLVDTLQSEQGTRYYRKRNRNLIVEVEGEVALPDDGDFRWVTRAELRQLLAVGERVNMNGRTVLSCLPFDTALDGGSEDDDGDDFRRAVRDSRARPVADDELGAALGWLVDQKAAFHLDTRRVRLADLAHWISDEESIRHEDGRFFRVIGVTVATDRREVGAWSQPMLAPTHAGYALLVVQRRAGVLEALVHARVEPGFLDSVEIGATAQFSPGNYLRPEDLPPFAALVDGPPAWQRLRAPQSEDGGRFFHDDTTHVVVEIPEGERLDLPPHFRWMSLALLERLIARGYLVAIEARSLLACLA